jgi:hypothetical protein
MSQNEVVYLDGRVDHSSAPLIRSMINTKKIRIAEAFVNGSLHLAAHLARDLREFEQLNKQYLIPRNPVAKRR